MGEYNICTGQVDWIHIVEWGTCCIAMVIRKPHRLSILDYFPCPTRDTHLSFINWYLYIFIFLVALDCVCPGSFISSRCLIEAPLYHCYSLFTATVPSQCIFCVCLTRSYLGSFSILGIVFPAASSFINGLYPRVIEENGFLIKTCKDETNR